MLSRLNLSNDQLVINSDNNGVQIKSFLLEVITSIEEKKVELQHFLEDIVKKEIESAGNDVPQEDINICIAKIREKISNTKKNLAGNDGGMRYLGATINLALGIFLKSKSVYNMIRIFFLLLLPHPSTNP